MAHRVVVTGIGMLSPLGVGHRDNWSRLISGETGIDRIHGFKTSDLACQIAGQIPRGEGEFKLSDWITAKDRRRLEPFIHYAAIAADICLADAGLPNGNGINHERTGVMIGSGTGGLEGIEKASLTLALKGPSRVSPLFVPSSIINQASSYVAIRHKLQGPNLTIVTACASGANAIGESARLIADGSAESMLAGGSEGSICRLGISGFAAMRALSTGFNHDARRASRPWDKDRDGFVMGEGAAILFMETLESARARSALVYGEVLGYGLSCDAFHLTAPDPKGNGVCMAMDMAIGRSSCSKDDIGYINAHATSTSLGDDIELQSVERFFGSHVANLKMSSTKGATGHLLGAAGALEAAYSLLALKHNILPPTLNLERPSRDTEIDLLPLKALKPERPIRTVMSNSFGFGGVNASLIFGSV